MRISTSPYKRRLISKQYIGLAFVLPAVLYFAVFRLFPMLMAFWVSFHEWDLLSEPTFVWLKNYSELFQNADVWKAMRITFVYAFGSTIPIWVVSLALALLLNRPFRPRRWYMMGFFLPAVFSVTVVSIIWKFIYQPQGVFNVFLWQFFGKTADWLTSSALAPFSLIIMSVWHRFGYFVVIFLAGLQGIPGELYEAAHIDGASGLKAFFYITIPQLKPTMALVMVVSLLQAFQAFDQQFIMTEGGPVGATRVLTLYVYQNAFLYLRMGWASTVALLLFVILVAMTLIQLRIFREDGY